MLDEKDLDNYGDVYIFCAPLSLCPNPPDDQQDCVVEKCPQCDVDMWVSIKKRKIRDNAKIKKKNDVKVWCGICVVKEQIGHQGAIRCNNLSAWDVKNF